MKARIPKHREFIIDFPQDMDQAKADEGWNKAERDRRGVQEEGPTAARASTLRPSLRTASLHRQKLQEYGFKYTIRKSSDLHRRTTASRRF